MRWVLRCNAVKLWGSDDHAFYHVKLANNEGLDVYLQFEPIAENPDIELDRYEIRLARFAKKAEEHDVKVLSVGNEMELWSKEFGSEGLWGWTDASFASRRAGKVETFVDELVQVARGDYSGLLTYTDWWASPWGYEDVNWNTMDMVSLNLYIGKASDSLYLNTIIRMRNKYPLPFIVSETGSLTIAEADEADGDDSYLWRFPVHHNPQKQAGVIDRQLKLIYQAEADGVFVYAWDRSTWRNMNKLGFGIWDYVEKEPKLSFWTVYKYYKD